MSEIKINETVADVVSALGGTRATAEIFDEGYTTIRQWMVRGFPPKKQADILMTLRKRGVVCDNSLFPDLKALLEEGGA